MFITQNMIILRTIYIYSGRGHDCGECMQDKYIINYLFIAYNIFYSFLVYNFIPTLKAIKY